MEFVRGMGPTLGEVVVGPDASNYVVLLIPTGKQIPVNAGKVRLVQKAATPAAGAGSDKAVAVKLPGNRGNADGILYPSTC